MCSQYNFVILKLDVLKQDYAKGLQKVLDDTFGAIPSAAVGTSVDEGWREYARNLHACALQVVGRPWKINQD